MYGAMCDSNGIVVRVAVVPEFVTDLTQYILDVGVMPYIPEGFSTVLSEQQVSIGQKRVGTSLYDVWKSSDASSTPYVPDENEDFTPFIGPVQPEITGYPLGYVVFHNGSLWRSMEDNNTSEPNVENWEAL